MVINKKIRGATSIEYNDIRFRSHLEYYCYKHLEASGLKFEYEPDRFTIWEGLKLKFVEVFAPRKLGLGRYEKEMMKSNRALLSTTYTPDFRVNYKEYIIYFDVKGKENDVYPLKKKMFLRHLEEIASNSDKKYIFFEPHSVGQMKQAIELIKEL